MDASIEKQEQKDDKAMEIFLDRFIEILLMQVERENTETLVVEGTPAVRHGRH